MKWHDHFGSIIDSKNGYDVIDCNLCNFKHIVPIPSSENLEKYYRDEFVESKPMYVEKITEDLAWWNLNFDEKYDVLEQNLEPEKRSLLDIGCGFGYFLKFDDQEVINHIGNSIYNLLPGSESGPGGVFLRYRSRAGFGKLTYNNSRSHC